LAEWGLGEIRPRDGHDVERGSGRLAHVRLPLPEDLAQPSLGAIAKHGAPDATRGDDAESVPTQRVYATDERHIP